MTGVIWQTEGPMGGMDYFLLAKAYQGRYRVNASRTFRYKYSAAIADNGLRSLLLKVTWP